MYDYIQDKSEYGTRQEVIYNVILMGEITIIHDQRMHKTRKKISRKLIKKLFYMNNRPDGAYVYTYIGLVGG